ncbi:MAG: single-stranded DNA-binding protein [Oscillospiraceae bacterium]
MINKVVLVGRLTSDPEVRQTQSGLSVVSFTVACNRPYQKNGERTADFINCVAWRQTAEFVGKYFRKGNAIGLDGSIQTRRYQDKDGNNRTAVEVVVDSVSFVESKNASSNYNAQPSSNDFSDYNNEPAPSKETGSVNYSSGSVDDFEELESDMDLPF